MITQSGHKSVYNIDPQDIIIIMNPRESWV